MRTNRRGEIFVSCLASNFKQPIADMVDRLLTVRSPDLPEDPPRVPEVDYATTLLVLLVFSFEAWISRARFLDRRTHANVRDKKDVLPWMRSLRDPKLQQIIESLGEIYFLRDAIVHNHIWTYVQSWEQDRACYSNFDFDLTWQSRPSRFDEIVRGKLPLAALPRSKRLNLVVVPTFIGRREVAIVFKVVKEALNLLNELGYVKIVPRVPHVRFGGKLSFPFWSLIGVIQRSFLIKKMTR